jgi:hypothetical protein
MSEGILQRRVALCRKCGRIGLYVTEGTTDTTPSEWDATSNGELKSFGWKKYPPSLIDRLLRRRSPWVCEQHR